METLTLVCSSLRDGSSVSDIGATITGISGVVGVTVDVATKTVSVAYDPGFVHPSLIENSLVGAGYPVERAEQSTGQP